MVPYLQQIDYEIKQKIAENPQPPIDNMLPTQMGVYEAIGNLENQQVFNDASMLIMRSLTSDLQGFKKPQKKVVK